MLSPAQAAAMAGISLKTLERRCALGKGPPSTRVGRCRVFDEGDVRDFVERERAGR